MIVCESFARVLKKAGIDVSQKFHLKKLEQRRQEQKDGEEQKTQRRRKEVHIRRQIRLRIKSADDKGPEVESIQEEAQANNTGCNHPTGQGDLDDAGRRAKKKKDGRVGEALGWMSRALSKEGRIAMNPPCRGLLRKQE
jgi:hypothetical protein